MASINKLSIRGVRSFSPEDREQVVEFYFPVTIIVGANGCGKTTIIESLKYAITGGLPPGARSGQSFIHDARSIGQTTVKAHVKLRFTSKADQSMVVVRSMELTQKKTTASFKQLDGVIRSMDPRTGERVSLSHKCSELDKQVPQLMGVSKAILDYVLFCHQEDSSWPLQEGAILKKRFDDIFDSTRYTKAVDVMRKKEKQLVSLSKDIKAELAGLNSHKHAASGFRKELEDYNEVMEEIDEMGSDLRKKMKETQDEIDRYQDIIDQMDGVQTELDRLKNERYQQELMVEKQRQMLENDYTKDHSMSQLENMLRDFERTRQDQVDQLEELQETQRQMLDEIEKFRKENSRYFQQKAQLEARKETNDKHMRDRLQLMESLAQTYDLDLGLLSQTSVDQSFTANMSMVSGTNGLTQDSVVTITPGDMENFLNSVKSKQEELQNKLAEQKARTKSTDSELYATIGNLQRKIDAIDSDLKRLAQQKTDYNTEVLEISRKVSAGSRTRKTDVEEARRKAEKLAKQRDDANTDPRRTEIPTEIRAMEDNIDRLKRQIEEDKFLVETLRSFADAQNSIDILRDQCARDMETLEENLRDQASTFQKYNIPLPELPSVEEDNGEALQKAVESLVDTIRSKYDNAHTDLTQASDEILRTQQILSEKNALLANSTVTLNSLKSRVVKLADGSVSKVRKIAQDLRRHEQSLGLPVVRVTEETPRDLLKYLNSRLETLEEDAPVEDAAPTLKKLVKRLRKMAKVADDSEHGYHFSCPCCVRDLEDEDSLRLFQDTLAALASDTSPLLKVDARHQETKTRYVEWKKIVVECMDDLRDYQRMNKEMNDTEKEHQRLSEDASHFQAKLRNQKSEKTDLQVIDEELRDITELSKRWSEDAGRLAEKRMQIGQKELDLSASVTDSGRDLKTVEREMNEKMEEKDMLSNKINTLNREATKLNTLLANLSSSAAAADKLAREKEQRFEEERKGAERKIELQGLLKDIASEEKQKADQIAPFKKKISAKKIEQERMRSFGEEEEEKSSTQLASFQADVKDLRNLTSQIDIYEQGGHSEEYKRISSKITAVQDKISKKQKSVDNLLPRLDETKIAVQDQDRHKKQITQSIEILKAEKNFAALDQEIKVLQEKTEKIEGADTAWDKLNAAQKLQAEQQESKHRTEGRYSEVVEQIRSVKRKLSAPEYRNVEEQHREAMIRHETTQLAAEDMKKYYTAVDKALLLFHGIKIQEINKIISELWRLTYKGEDITNIEIVSGQEAGSKAKKSYNYRVCMQKGSTRMDMRGRCSAGQRVLACIVIRLALAETFGVNCGCLALDEPTVNLDVKHSRALAIALAQIISSRSQQRNFQLVVITHDEHFVGMIKTELASLSGFSMPEKYFQVRREQGIDGKFYSKIDAIDWDELL